MEDHPVRSDRGIEKVRENLMEKLTLFENLLLTCRFQYILWLPTNGRRHGPLCRAMLSEARQISCSSTHLPLTFSIEKSRLLMAISPVTFLVSKHC
jgi:hypothetical protein